MLPPILYSCPCSDSDPVTKTPLNALSTDLDTDVDLSQEGSTFDPWAPRSTFSLFPINTLYFCEDCNQMRCPRCVSDEIVCYYCPNCLFESPASAIKAEGSRCTRNCFSCPLCFATLIVTPTTPDQTPPYILLCPHCSWASSDIDITFEKPTSITAQLKAKIDAVPSPVPKPEQHFESLKEHYAKCKAASSADEHGAMARIRTMYSSSLRSYTGVSAAVSRTQQKTKPGWTEAEPLGIGTEAAVISRLSTAGWDDTPSMRQRSAQRHVPRVLSELLPIPALLRTKRSKRCRACRHILVKPDSKINSMRFRIRLMATNYITALSLQPLEPARNPPGLLKTGRTMQFLLTLTNPLFDEVTIQLATSRKTPGKYPAEVTVLCPSFTINANTDVWDEALGTAAAAPKRGKRQVAAGTIWDAGRNWTTVVVEVQPPEVPDEVGEEERRVKIPILVRAVYETFTDKEGKEVKEKKEQSFWCVVDVGRVEKTHEKAAREKAEEEDKEKEKLREMARERGEDGAKRSSRRLLEAR